jgi:phytanoyl-CoA hydroxylase
MNLRDDFERDGFVVLRGFLVGDELVELRRLIDSYIEHTVPALPAAARYYETPGDAATLKQLNRMTDEPQFRSILDGQRFARLAAELLADDVVPKTLQWFDKPPRVGKPTPPHQDGYYFMLEPNEALTAWLALDPVDERNGCMRYVPGSHRRGVRPHERTQTLGFSQGLRYGPDDFATEFAVPAEPGDLLVHHSLTIHRADGNPSERHRRSLGLVYFAAHARQQAERLAEYQRSLDHDLTAAGKI